MDLLMKKRFDFSRFAFKDEPGEESAAGSSDQRARIVCKPSPAYISDEERSNDVDIPATRSGRRVQPKTVVIDDSSEASSEEENEDAFKVSAYTNKKLAGKPKRVKKLKAAREELDISKEFVPLRSTNKSITVDIPLKSINNKLSNYDIANEKKALSDEINLLLGDDDSNSNQSDPRANKRKANKFSDDDSDSQIGPAKKRNKRKIILDSDDDSRPAGNANENDENEKECLDDIQVILDEEDYTEDEYENLLSSSDDEAETDDEKGEKKPKKGKSTKLEIKKALVSLCNEGKETELMSVAGLNKKVYDELVSLREFRDWADLKTKFENSEILSEDTIEIFTEYIKTNNVVSSIMDKCQAMSDRIKASVRNLKEHREPRCLNKKLKLKPYQLVGLNYLVLMFQQRTNCILADEMGLGKTIQVIALLAYLREECSIYGPHLIVVPSSILTNWSREFELWCPNIKILRYYGNQEERTQLRYEIISKSVRYDVIITTYNMLYSGDDKKLLTKVHFQYAVFDEAHMLKNMKSSRFKNLFAVKAKYRLMLTGTPIQNNLLELISLLTFTVPSLFLSKLTFMENFFKNKKFDGNKSDFVQQKTDQAKEILKPFIMRRIKENVLKDLPSKVEQYVELDMTEDQAKLYDQIVSGYAAQAKARKERKALAKKERLEEKVEIIEDRSRRRPKRTDYNEEKLFYVEELDNTPSKKRTNGELTVEDGELTILDQDEPTLKLEVKLNADLVDIASESSSDVWSVGEDAKSAKERQSSILMELRKCANHPLLVRNLYTNELLLKMAQILKKKEPYYQKDGCVQYMIEDMEVLNDFDLHMLCKKFPSIGEFQLTDEQILASGKFNYLDGALAEFRAKDQKVLIFSQFVMMLDIIEEYLRIRSHKYCRLDGSTKVTERMSKIDSFKDKEITVFLLTTRAGGMGINLVEANQVIIFDNDWNPYNDLQAQARAHRIGQTQEVNVFKLVSNGTVEVHMKQICEEKLQVGRRITNDEVEKKNEESNDVKRLLKKALNI